MNELKIIEDMLFQEPKFIGDVFRLDREGKTVHEIAAHFGHKTTMNVTSFLYAIKGILGEVGVADLKFSSRKQLVFTAERMLSVSNSPDVQSHLERILEQVHSLADADSPTLDNKPVSHESSVSGAGVYVYSYPQYLSMEAVSPNGSAFYKIGASMKFSERIKRQRRQTEVPEDLVLVRVFYNDDPFDIERKFHNILTAANLHQKTTQGGIEWFVCNLATIDAIADALGLTSSV